MTHTYITTIEQPTLHYLTRSVHYVLTRLPERFVLDNEGVAGSGNIVRLVLLE
jgi:hypothetical protein